MMTHIRFLENFYAGPNGLTIKQEGKVYSGTGEAGVPFIAVEDIAAAAVEALTAEKSYNNDYVIIGPELLSYGDVSDQGLPRFEVVFDILLYA